ncbi:MAG: hypothetical protein ACYSU5_24030, partial [Planctomycetota bacterium]
METTGQVRGVAPVCPDTVDVIRVVILARLAPLALDERVNEVCAFRRPVDSSPDGAVLAQRYYRGVWAPVRTNRSD